MTFAPIDSMHDSDNLVSPQERFRAMLTKMIKRRKSISPNPADGFYSEQGKALSDAEGSDVTVAPGINNQN